MKQSVATDPLLFQLSEPARPAPNTATTEAPTASLPWGNGRKCHPCNRTFRATLYPTLKRRASISRPLPGLRARHAAPLHFGLSRRRSDWMGGLFS